MMLRLPLLALVAAAGVAASDTTSGANPLPGSSYLRMQPPLAGYGVSPLQRTTIFVRDQARSLKLYRDLLGMKVYFDHSWGNAGINSIMNTRGETLRAVVLEGDHNLYGKLGIYQLSQASVARAAPPSRSTHAEVGDLAVVLATDRIDLLAARLTAEGYSIVSPATVLVVNPAYAVQQREMMFRDPDGVLVNLVQPGVPRS